MSVLRVSSLDTPQLIHPASHGCSMRQHNLIRIAAIIARTRPNRTIYFLIGYTEELLSLWLKCPVKLELQTTSHEVDTVYKYI